MTNKGYLPANVSTLKWQKLEDNKKILSHGELNPRLWRNRTRNPMVTNHTAIAKQQTKFVKKQTKGQTNAN